MKKFVIAAILSSACGMIAQWQAHSAENRGRVCLGDNASLGQADISLSADAALSFTVALVDCLSSSCSRNARANCNVEVQGTILTITSSAEWETASGDDIACTADCLTLSGGCTTPVLAAGTYTVKHGDKAVDVTIPGMSPACPPGLAE